MYDKLIAFREKAYHSDEVGTAGVAKEMEDEDLDGVGGGATRGHGDVEGHVGAGRPREAHEEVGEEYANPRGLHVDGGELESEQHCRSGHQQT